MARLPKEEELSEQAARARSDALFTRFEGERGLHARAKWRTQHMYQDPAVDPIMPGATFSADGKVLKASEWQASAHQTSRLKVVNQRLKARVCENKWKIEGRPVRSTQQWQAKANAAEALLSQGFEWLEVQTGSNLQENLYDGLAYRGVGVLHWRIDDTEYKHAMPDYDESDEPEEGDEGRWTEDDYDEESKRKKGKKYRETEDSLKDRIARYKAECGFPVYAETLLLQQCAWRQDKSTYSRFAEFAYKRVVPTLAEWKLTKQEDKRLRERPGPSEDTKGSLEHWTPSSQDYEHEATITTLWTRRYWYEWCEGNGGEQYFDSGEHWYGEPPFALAVGRYADENDAAWAYLPALDAMLEEKPEFDRRRSLLGVAVEAAAVQKWFLKRDRNAGTATLQDGDLEIDMSAHGGTAAAIPDGFDLVARGGEGVNRQLFETYSQVVDDMAFSEPGTGFATFGASTQPWSARQERDQENMEPKIYIRNIAKALQAMVNNLARCFADKEHGPGEVFGWAKTGDGALDRSKVLSLNPDDFEGIILDVSIHEVGGLERTSLMETGMILVEKGRITDLEFIGDYEGKANPEEVYAQRLVFNIWKTEILPGMLRQAAAEYIGPKFAIAADGLPIGMDGRQVSDEQVIQANGQQPMVQPQPQAQPMAPGGTAAMSPPSMPGLQAPGTMPLQGMGGPQTPVGVF